MRSPLKALLITGSLVAASAWKDGLLGLVAHVNDPCGTNGTCNITLKDSLGSSVTLTLRRAKY